VHLEILDQLVKERIKFPFDFLSGWVRVTGEVIEEDGIVCKECVVNDFINDVLVFLISISQLISDGSDRIHELMALRLIDGSRINVEQVPNEWRGECFVKLLSGLLPECLSLV
jgi:hypothetical protein